MMLGEYFVEFLTFDSPFAEPLGTRELAFFLDGLLFGNYYLFLQLPEVCILLVLDLVQRAQSIFTSG